MQRTVKLAQISEALSNLRIIRHLAFGQNVAAPSMTHSILHLLNRPIDIIDFPSRCCYRNRPVDNLQFYDLVL